MESLLERAEGRSTLKNFFEDNDKFVRLFLLSANQNFSLSFVYRMLKFVSRTLETCEYYYLFWLLKNISCCFVFSPLSCRVTGQSWPHSCSATPVRFMSPIFINLSIHFSLDEKQPNDPTAQGLVQSISKISEVDSSLLTTWLNRIIVGSVTDKEMTGKMADNRLLLQSIVSFLVKEQR